jgi:hypothetical protein
VAGTDGDAVGMLDGEGVALDGGATVAAVPPSEQPAASTATSASTQPAGRSRDRLATDCSVYVPRTSRTGPQRVRLVVLDGLP